MRRRMPILIAALAASLLLGACGSTVATSSFKGAQHEVAETISHLQSDVTAGEHKKVCENDMAAKVVQRLGGKKGCEAAVKTQLSEIDSTELTIDKIEVAGTSATAKVTNVYEGKKVKGSMTLAKEGSDWKITAVEARGS
jgi:hypothetical protein